MAPSFESSALSKTTAHLEEEVARAPHLPERRSAFGGASLAAQIQSGWACDGQSGQAMGQRQPSWCSRRWARMAALVWCQVATWAPLERDQLGAGVEACFPVIQHAPSTRSAGAAHSSLGCRSFSQQRGAHFDRWATTAAQQRSEDRVETGQSVGRGTVML